MIRLRRRKQTEWALVTTQDGTEHVSPMRSLDDAADMLDLEHRLHEGTGWTVDRYGATMRAAKGRSVRWIWIRPVT